MIDSIIFDLDGTLWDACESTCKSWNLTLEKYNDVTKKMTIEDLKSIMGLVIEDVAKKLLPEVSFERALEIAEKCCEEECGYICENGADIFEGLEDVLKQVSKDYKLFIVSNCQKGYIESFFTCSHFSTYFKDFECSGNTGLAKAENIQLIVERNGLSAPVYVGDTMGDYKACEKAKVPFIHAKYGFGMVPDGTNYINDIRELPEAIKEL